MPKPCRHIIQEPDLLLETFPGGIVPAVPQGSVWLGLGGCRIRHQLQAAQAEDVNHISKAGFACGCSVPGAQLGKQMAQAALGAIRK